MSTYVYGGRDFKGNIVSNAAMTPVAGAPSSWPAPVQDGNNGHVQWSTDEEKPYWWNTVTNKWISFNSGASADPWVAYNKGDEDVPIVTDSPDYPGMKQSVMSIASDTEGAIFLSHLHNPIIPFGGATLTLSNGASPSVIYVFESSFAGWMTGTTANILNHTYGGISSMTTIEGVANIPTIATLLYENGSGVALFPDPDGTLIRSRIRINVDYSIDLVTDTVATWDVHYIAYDLTILGQVPPELA